LKGHNVELLSPIHWSDSWINSTGWPGSISWSSIHTPNFVHINPVTKKVYATRNTLDCDQSYVYRVVQKSDIPVIILR